jgi:16S rRNA A1518/A1519 N6-dimethyltransferase RsmA/KsgA/DIM1 with predicted DNA glycosylase/AP lyase activity
LTKRYTIINKKSHLDQFYTNPEVAQRCVEKVLEVVAPEHRALMVEPSAGNGSFTEYLKLKHIPFISIDLEPKQPYIIEADFLKLEGFAEGGQVCIIGNPPFGRCSSLAIKFFNHGCKFGDTVAFIVPKTFRKQSVKDKLNLRYWLIHEEELGRDSFLLNETPYDVPCVFQICKSEMRAEKKWKCLFRA